MWLVNVHVHDGECSSPGGSGQNNSRWTFWNFFKFILEKKIIVLTSAVALRQEQELAEELGIEIHWMIFVIFLCKTNEEMRWCSLSTPIVNQVPSLGTHARVKSCNMKTVDALFKAINLKWRVYTQYCSISMGKVWTWQPWAWPLFPESETLQHVLTSAGNFMKFTTIRSRQTSESHLCLYYEYHMAHTRTREICFTRILKKVLLLPGAPEWHIS